MKTSSASRHSDAAVKPPPADAYAQHSNDVLSSMDSSLTGLTADEAAKRLVIYGHNQLPIVNGRHPLFRFLVQFHNALIYFLIAAALAALLLGHFVDAVVIVAVVLVNAIVGFV
ncbi:hypothetical protein J7J47_19080 [Halomonas sp. ISL-60]|uniref:cation-transporting P-type ATPase n=1 Tax=Halomonas sp. ISL-56 TaxID=2819149 RepID=UPI001BE5432A|nr:cation-transporting P-type ATPase [Halomonas sp. ISL-56]MBT2774335.1 hypothetical protein [Halomonas sp. ISL-60]MBT2799904.1 hypothetical protein [Halomonas sp. ISL-56]